MSEPAGDPGGGDANVGDAGREDSGRDNFDRDDPGRGDSGCHDRWRDDSARHDPGRGQGHGKQASGHVYLVGAGPGDPGLLSARALALIAAADVILYDRLIPVTALDGARADAELLFVGKQGGGASVPQEQTERLLIERARAGRAVVRLKGGDPFVFGRGGEEALALLAAGIPFEVVPAVTAGVAAAAYAGIPVTHRGVASAVALVTGHEDPDKDDTAIDWQALAAFPGTLVFYMGVRRLAAIAQSLIAAGRSAEEPVAIVERGTLPGQRTIAGTLATIADVATQAGVRAPSITIVGPVVALADKLAWLPQVAAANVIASTGEASGGAAASREAEGGAAASNAASDGEAYAAPLAGLSVAVTRARASASGLAGRLGELGARVIQAPVIRTVALPGPAPEIAGYDLLCLTSPVGVAQLFERLRAAGSDARALAGTRVAAIGPGTAQALSAQGIVADIVPARAVAEGLIEALTGVDPPVRRALIARAREGREELGEALRARGAQVDVLALYETVAEPLSAQALAEARQADYITFTSASTVRFFLAAAGGERGGAGRGGGEDGKAGSSEDIGQTDPGEGDGGRGRGGGEGSGKARLAAAATAAPGAAQVRLSPGTRIVSIGPITSRALREHGLEPHVQAAEHDIDGLVRALVADAAARG